MRYPKEWLEMDGVEMTKEELKKKASEFFEEHCTHGYGCCFEYNSVKKDAISAIERILRRAFYEGRTAGMEECRGKLLDEANDYQQKKVYERGPNGDSLKAVVWEAIEKKMMWLSEVFRCAAKEEK